MEYQREGVITLSDTYNENEILKLKHLNEFARQLNVKLDGGTDPKPTRPIFFGHRGGTAYIQEADIDNPITVDIDTLFPPSVSPVQIWFSAYRDIYDLDDTSRLLIDNLTTTDTTYNPTNIYYYREMYVSNPNSTSQRRSEVFIYCNRVPQTVEFDMFIAENDKYAETRHHITFIITEEA